jgi:hypothetical protein
MSWIKNFTPHTIKILTDKAEEVVLPVDGPAPRLAVTRELVGHADGIPVYRSVLGEPHNLPAPQPGVIFVVSALVAEHPALAGRDDLAYPGEAVRDSTGQVVGCRGLSAGPGLAKRLKDG